MATHGRKFLCGTPALKCTGGLLKTDQVFSTSKVHARRDEAMRCYTAYLVAEGYERLSPTTFRPPNGGPILIIPKTSKFGGELRPGKEGRFMPRHRGQGLIL